MTKGNLDWRLQAKSLTEPKSAWVGGQFTTRRFAVNRLTGVIATVQFMPTRGRSTLFPIQCQGVDGARSGVAKHQRIIIGVQTKPVAVGISGEVKVF